MLFAANIQDVTDYEGGGDLTVGLSEEGTFFGLTAEEMTQVCIRVFVCVRKYVRAFTVQN